jgi:hypothetical protein
LRQNAEDILIATGDLKVPDWDDPLFDEIEGPYAGELDGGPL